MKGTRPNPFVQLFHDRGVRLAAGLAIVVAIPMAVLFYFQFRSLNDIETTSAVVLRQLSSETADSLIRSVEDYLNARMISEPLALFDCDVPIEGCTALVMTTADRAKDLRTADRPVYLLGSGESCVSPLVSQMDDMSSS